MFRKGIPLQRAAWILAWLISWPSLARPMDVVTFTRDGRSTKVEGRIEVEAADGGFLLLGRDGVLWSIQPDEITDRLETEQPFRAFTSRELAGQLRASLPAGFVTRETKHYVIAYNTTRAYAAWCGSLLERVHRVFYDFWPDLGLALETPSFPLVAVIFEDRGSFEQFSRPEVQGAAGSVVGYYNMETNRVTMYDLTGLEQLRPAGARPNTSLVVQQILSQPAAAPNIATIVHEATHQLAFNSGLQTRYADNPLWVSEGLAVFFESPDLGSSKGWRKAGGLHLPRLDRFQRGLSHRSESSLAELISTDARLRDPKTAMDSYAEAWALCYFLLRERPHEFTAYLGELAELPPLASQTAAERRQRFIRHFGDLGELDQRFVRYVSALPDQQPHATRRSQ